MDVKEKGPRKRQFKMEEQCRTEGRVKKLGRGRCGKIRCKEKLGCCYTIRMDLRKQIEERKNN